MLPYKPDRNKEKVVKSKLQKERKVKTELAIVIYNKVS